MLQNLTLKITRYLLPVIFGILLISRFLYLDFGLPHVLQADEAEMAEYSLKYAVNLKKVLEGDLLFFKPFSFVYGSLPAYTNAILLVPFLKITSIFELSQDRYYIYLYLRFWYALFSILACIGVYLLTKKLIKKISISYLAAILFSLNFYFLWLSKYLNNDILTVLFTIYFLLFYFKYEESENRKNLIYAMIFIGLGVSTKITFCLVLLYPIYRLIKDKRFKELIYSFLTIFLIYLITNPFTFVYPLEFISRVMEMRVKENGVVIDSYNTSYLKYLESLANNLTIPVVLLGLLKTIIDLKNKKFDILSSIILIFIVFFSTSSRLVDRWLLPIYPLLIINFFLILERLKHKVLKISLIILVLILTTILFIQANIELSNGSNLQKSYLDFIQNYTESGKTVYIVTERGLNPFGYVVRKQMFYAQAPLNLYVSQGGFDSFPDQPEKYDFIVFSSRVRDYYLNPYIIQLNPGYVKKWEEFYLELLNKEKFELISYYSSPSKSIINQENIIIFKKKISN